MAIRPHYVSFMIPSLLAGEEKAKRVIERTFDFSIIRFFQVFSERYNSVKQWQQNGNKRGGDSTETFLEKVVLKVSDQIIKKQNKKVKRGTV